MQKNQKNVENITEKALKCLNEIAKNNSVVGVPIKAEDYTIIPISKITVGLLCGGGEYGDVKVIKKSETFPISAGSGTVVSIKPSGFLVIGKDVKLLKTDNNLYEGMFEKIEGIVGKLNEKK